MKEIEYKGILNKDIETAQINIKQNLVNDLVTTTLFLSILSFGIISYMTHFRNFSIEEALTYIRNLGKYSYPYFLGLFAVWQSIQTFSVLSSRKHLKNLKQVLEKHQVIISNDSLFKTHSDNYYSVFTSEDYLQEEFITYHYLLDKKKQLQVLKSICQNTYDNNDFDKIYSLYLLDMTEKETLLMEFNRTLHE